VRTDAKSQMNRKVGIVIAGLYSEGTQKDLSVTIFNNIET